MKSTQGVQSLSSLRPRTSSAVSVVVSLPENSFDKTSIRRAAAWITTLARSESEKELYRDLIFQVCKTFYDNSDKDVVFRLSHMRMKEISKELRDLKAELETVLTENELRSGNSAHPLIEEVIALSDRIIYEQEQQVRRMNQKPPRNLTSEQAVLT